MADLHAIPARRGKAETSKTAAEDLKSTNLTNERENSNDFLVIEVFNFFAYQTPSFINALNLNLKLILLKKMFHMFPKIL